MAVQPPPAPVIDAQAPPPAKTGRSCLGCGCGGCLIAIATPVDVDTNNSAGFHPGKPGQELSAGNTVRTGDGGHAAIQFPDGSYVRMAPATVVTVTAAQLSHDGNLQSASLVQKVGR